MKKRPFYLCLIFIMLFASFSTIGMPIANASGDELQLYDSTIEFQHFDYQIDENYLLKGYDKEKIVTTTFHTKVIENALIKVTLLPEFGGRILSIIYKPTGHELLYQNPIGTPYGIDEGNFYYNWLMVYGGIFPTFPEPEHGKAWGLPWETKITEQTPDKISVEMKFTDTIAPVAGVPGQFDNGKTDITCISTVTVYKDKSYVDYNIQLINNRDTTVKYEYWTCTTFAPGSEPGKTICPPNTEIIAPIDQVLLRDNWWAWMGEAEKPLQASNHIFEYKNLATFGNWTDMGIAYANPSVEKNWWGVINHENEVGVLRIAPNKDVTPGLKFWTWGKNSANTDPKTFGDSSRPYIELWGGHSSEFFADTALKPNEKKVWTEFYMPTSGLTEITSANENAAIQLSTVANANEKNIHFNAGVFTTKPGEKLQAILKLKSKNSSQTQSQQADGDKNQDRILWEGTLIGDAKTANTLSALIPTDSITKGEYLYCLELKNQDGATLAEAQIPFNAQFGAEAPKDSTSEVSKVLGNILIPLAALLLLYILTFIIRGLRKSHS